MTNSNRRNFLKTMGFATLSSVALAVWGTSKIAFATALKYIDMAKKDASDQVNNSAVAMATNIGYVDDADAAEKKALIKREDKKVGAQVMKAKEQICGNCSLYNQPAAEQCALIPGVKVAKKGYCKMYSPKF